MAEDGAKIGFSKEHQKLYRELTEKSSSPFYKKNFADVFVFSLAFAIESDLPPTNLVNREANIPFSALGKKEWLLNAVAIVEGKDYKTLSKQKEVMAICEKYANSGIVALYKEVFHKEGSFVKRMENLCRERIRKSGI